MKCTPLLELKAIKIVGNIVRRGVTLLSKEVVLPSVRIAAAQITSDVLLEDIGDVDGFGYALLALCPSGYVDALTREERGTSIRRERS